MVKSQFIFLCDRLGDPNLGANEKWKSIKYIFVENPIVDVQRLLKNRQIMYIDNSDIGPGFYILSNNNSDLGISNFNNFVITFIPLKIIDKISIITSINSDNGGSDNDDGNNILYVETIGDTLIFNNNLDICTYEDTIIINNVTANTDNDTLIINKK